MHAVSLIEELPTLWQKYKISLKHKRRDMSLTDLIMYIRIAKHNRQFSKKLDESSNFNLAGEKLEKVDILSLLRNLITTTTTINSRLILKRLLRRKKIHFWIMERFCV